ncbi:uncharacterized protein [Dysidea avara]|uniref:uncharacterized protein n=1 Tax=Dysidea avara TaxID=196820 RepID=UPI00333253A5
MEEQAKPRVNGATIAKFVGKRVTIVGRYVSSERGGHTLLLETSDKQQLRANLPSPPLELPSAFVEVVGKVEHNCQLAVERLVNFGNDFDLDTYNEAIQFLNNCPVAFPDS